MKFSLVIDLERFDPNEDMREVTGHMLEMVQMADEGGFEIVWASEHHAIEMTISPNPFQQLAWLAPQTDRIRLGVAVIQAPYWHPIKAAGEAGLLDILSNGRLELGLGRGAYQREFDRMMGGMDQHKGVAYMQEMLPLLKQLWAGDVAHDGEFWSFPKATACPKPLQKPHPPLWVAARHPTTYDWALPQGCNIMSWALTRPFNEVVKYKQQFEEALERAPGIERPKFATMRHTGVYPKSDDWPIYVQSLQRVSGSFENLFKQLGEVDNGFAEPIDLKSLENRAEYDPHMLRDNLIFGTPEEVIAKLKPYEDVGVDNFFYRATYGLPRDLQKQSLRMFIDEVMPAFAEDKKAEAAE